MKSYTVWIAVAVVVVALAITVPMILFSGDDEGANPHSPEDLARLTAQMAVDYSNQKAAYNDLLAANPNDDLALSGLGQIAMLENDYPTAVNYVNQAIAITADDPYLYMLLGEGYYKMKLSDKAIEAMDQAVALAPEDQEILLNAGYVYDQGGRKDEARQLWQRAYDLNPTSEAGKNAFHALNPDIPLDTETTVNPHVE